MLGCIQPISSPMMNKILGFCCGCCADAGTLGTVMATSDRAVVIKRLLLTRMDGFLPANCPAIPNTAYARRTPRVMQNLAARHEQRAAARARCQSYCNTASRSSQESLVPAQDAI